MCGIVPGRHTGAVPLPFCKLIPPQKSGEYFGIMDICGKGASFIGTALVGFVSQVTGSTNQGVAVLAVVFVVGLVLFRVSVRIKNSNLYLPVIE